MTRRRRQAFVKPPKFTPARPKSYNQKEYLKAIDSNSVVICRGHAGSGKTLLALSAALKLFYDRSSPYEKIIIVRPYIKSNIGEDIGALPGKLDQKVGPFVESIMDNLRQLCTKEEASRLIRERDIDFTVLSMCRGRSFNDCVVIVEEAQNVPINGNGMKMLLTRIGNNCKMVIAGDTDQLDIPSESSALTPTIELVSDINNVAVISMFDKQDVQRSQVVRDILEKFENGKQNSTGMRFIQNRIRPGANGHNLNKGERQT